MAYELPFKLNRPDLLITDSYIAGQTKSALSGATFDVLGNPPHPMLLSH
jgi:hypothetical protein